MQKIHSRPPLENQKVPEMTDEWVATISDRYIELYEQITGTQFVKEQISEEETYNRIVASLQKLQQKGFENV